MSTRFRTLISAPDLRALVDRHEVTVFDCSFDLLDPLAGRAAYRGGHIPGAVYLDLDTDLSSAASAADGRHPLPDTGMFAALLRKGGVRSGRQVVAYDRSGGPFAARLWWLLRWLGHDVVAVLDGGLAAWTAADGALETGDAPYPADGDFVAAPRDDMVVSVDSVLAALGSKTQLVIDARSPERFRGDPHPFDPVAGHIPGARNRFYQHNLDGDGRWKSPELLAAEFAAITGNDSGKLVLQCGSGVTACHNALALAHAGRTDWRLYPGSWSQWIGNADRPVERG